MRALAVCSAMLMTLLVTGALLAPTALAEGITLEEIGDHSLECEAGSSVEYEWFVYNSFPSPFLLELSVEPVSGTGWSSEFGQQFVLLSPGEGYSIGLTVSSTNDVTSEDVVQTVHFTFTELDNSTNMFVLDGTAETSMIPVWGIIAPGKNKLLGMFDNPLPAPLDSNYVTFVINVCLWAGIAGAFIFVVDPIVRMFTKKTKTDLDDRVLKILRKPIFALVIAYGVVDSFSILPLSEREVGEIFVIYGIVLIVILTFVAYRIFKEVLIFLGKKYSTKTESKIDDVLIPVIDKIGGILIMVFGAMSIITYLGYDITFLLAGVGVFGLVIAFAAQDALSNFFSGIFMLLDRPFQEGEYIQLPGGEMCRVENIGIRSTRLYDVTNNDFIILPNNKLVNDKIVNLNKPDKEGKWSVTVGVAYGSDVDEVQRIMLEAAMKHPNILKGGDKDPVVRFNNFGDSALEFKIFFWVDDFMNQWKAAHDLRVEYSKRFPEAGIEIPFPARTLYIKEMPKQK